MSNFSDLARQKKWTGLLAVIASVGWLTFIAPASASVNVPKKMETKRIRPYSLSTPLKYQDEAQMRQRMRELCKSCLSEDMVIKKDPRLVARYEGSNLVGFSIHAEGLGVNKTTAVILPVKEFLVDLDNRIIDILPSYETAMLKPYRDVFDFAEK